MRRDINAKATRDEIVRVARTAFANHGYAGVKLEDVARAAKATTGAIYHHFGGKSGLMLAVGEHVEREVVASIGARVPRDADPWEAIDAVALATLELCSKPEVARIIFKEAPNTLGVVAWREVEMRYGLGGLRALFDRAAATGALRPDDPEMVTRLFMAALIEAVDTIVEHPGKDRMAAARDALAGLLAAFRAPDMSDGNQR